MLLVSQVKIMKVRFTRDECTELYNKVEWDVYAEACVGSEVVMASRTDDSDVHTIEVEREVIDLGEDEMVPLRLCYTLTAPPGRELALDNLHILLTLDGYMNNEKVAHWASYLGPTIYATRAFDSIQSTPIMAMDTEGLHFATAVYTETFPRKWKSIEVFISPIAIQRALEGE